MSGGELTERAEHGINLFKQGFSDNILMSGGPSCGLNSSCLEIMKNRAIQMGVPRDKILLDEESTTTYENARSCFEIMQKQGYQSAILVTSCYHTKRAKIIFNRFFYDKGIDLTVCAVPNVAYPVEKWWNNDTDAQRVVTEYLKIIYYHLFTSKKQQ